MKLHIALVAVSLALMCCVNAQQYFFSGQFPAGDVFNSPQGAARDPRQNRGPVVFPPSPPDAVDETSGVVVGASGFGFVPPQQTNVFGRK